ncbi:TPA: nucleotidyltransferase family protein, partial [Salmonella enterica subsp. enterica serovar Typhimurium var. 5-]|nr:nucleotidyltransferase family protein [Salmonella enterica subsp. enterica serovar Typhimurium var. 5-]
YQSNILKMLMLSGESESLSKRLSEKNIRSIFLKGSILAADIYGDISLRTSSDIDLLIPLEDLEQTESTLLNLGYVKDDYILTILNDWKWRHHHITFIHPMKKIKVEIHWRLNPGPSCNPSFEELWNRKKRSLITNFPVYMLGNEDLFVFLSSHGARHGWSRLRWLMDIHMLIQQDLNWDSVKKLLRKYHLCSIGGQALILSGELFHSCIPHGLEKLVARKKSNQLASDAMFYIKQLINLHDEPLPREVSKYHQRHLFGQMSLLHKTLFILSFFYPYPEDAQALPLPKPFHFLYFPLRPFIWAWRRKHRHAML